MVSKWLLGKHFSSVLVWVVYQNQKEAASGRMGPLEADMHIVTQFQLKDSGRMGPLEADMLIVT